VGKGESLRLRLILLAIFAVLLVVFYGLRRHKGLQSVLGLAVLGVVTFFTVRGDLADRDRDARQASLVPHAPATCFALAGETGPAALDSLDEPQEFGYPAKTLDRVEVRDRLIDGAYDSLDSLLTAYSDSARRDFRLEYRMIDAFGAFSTAAANLEPFLDDWVKARPSSGNALLARATYYAASGWHARGGSISLRTSFRRMMGAQSNFTRALSDLHAGLRLSPCSIVGYHAFMSIAPYNGDTAMSREAMAQALLIQPYSFVSRELHMLNLRPRWGGSHEAMDRLAGEADSLVDRNPRLRALHGFSAWDEGDEAERKHDTIRALDLYDRALTFGDFWRFRMERGQLYHRLDREADALADLERALVQRPQSARLLDLLAGAKYELGRSARGGERDRLFYETYGDESLATLLEPDDEDYQRSMAFYKSSIPEYAH
jgi:tetratricopeptide (TPR) repeat protein